MNPENENILQKLEEVLMGQPDYLLVQAKRAVFVELINSWDEARYLPKDIKEKLKNNVLLEIKGETQKSKDQSRKALIYLKDGHCVETVLMSHKDRNTLCLSSQVGCLMGCVFCATGKSGFKRNLTIDEIISQYLFFQRILKKENKKIDNLVFMGMGEPFLNYDNVLEATRIISRQGRLGARHISFSTSGIIEGIKKLSREPEQFNLAVSLHAFDDKLRQIIMPKNNSLGGVKKLMKTLAEYIKKTKRRVMIEYILLENINDSPEQAEKLADLLKKNLPNLFFVNLIKYNPVSGFFPPETKVIQKFKKILKSKGIETTERQRLGKDIRAACGQLAGRKKLL